MGMISEFKDFAVKGNMVDMAVGLVMGAAFGTIISSLVKDILMPIVSSVFGLPDFSQLHSVLKEPVTALPAGVAPSIEAIREAGGTVLAYGNFINACLAFFMVAFALFFVIKAINKVKKAEAEAPPEPTASESLLGEIRDLLKR